MKYIPIIFVLLLASGAFIPLLMDDSTGLTAALHGDDRLQGMWGVIDLGGVLVCALHGRQLIRVASRQPFIVLLVAWAVLSTAWSGDPELTARRSLGLACTVALGFFFGMRFEIKDFIRIVAVVLGIGVFASIVAGILFPSFSIMPGWDGGAWRGVYIHKNTMAHLIGLAVIVFGTLALESRRNRPLYLIFLFLSVVLLALSKSMTAVIVTFLIVSLWFCLKLRLRPAQWVAVIALVLLLAMGTGFLLQGHTDFIFASMGRDVTLSGRTQLWGFCLAAVFERPLLGAGWDSFWMGPYGDTIRGLAGWPAAHAHDAFLDLALTIGLPGLALFLASISDCIHRAWQYGRQPWSPLRLFPLVFYSYIFFYMFTEASSVDRHSLFNILYCAISVSLTETSRVEVLEQAQEKFICLPSSPPIPS